MRGAISCIIILKGPLNILCLNAEQRSPGSMVPGFSLSSLLYVWSPGWQADHDWAGVSRRQRRHGGGWPRWTSKRVQFLSQGHSPHVLFLRAWHTHSVVNPRYGQCPSKMTVPFLLWDTASETCLFVKPLTQAAHAGVSCLGADSVGLWLCVAGVWKGSMIWSVSFIESTKSLFGAPSGAFYWQVNTKGLWEWGSRFLGSFKC